MNIKTISMTSQTSCKGCRALKGKSCNLSFTIKSGKPESGLCYKPKLKRDYDDLLIKRIVEKEILNYELDHLLAKKMILKLNNDGKSNSMLNSFLDQIEKKRFISKRQFEILISHF